MYIGFGDSHSLQLLNAHTATALLLNLEISLLLLVSFISCSSARSQLFSTNLYADNVKQHHAGLWMTIVLSQQGFVKKPVLGSELHGVHKLIWGYGGGAKICARVKPWWQIELYAN